MDSSFLIIKQSIDVVKSDVTDGNYVLKKKLLKNPFVLFLSHVYEKLY